MGWMLELEHGFRVVDVHARLEPDEDRRPRADLGTPERLEREMHQAGIVRSVVSAGPREDGYLKANNAVARMSVGRSLVAVARITGARDPGSTPAAKLRNLTASRKEVYTSPGDVEQYAYDDRFVGFKLHPAGTQRGPYRLADRLPGADVRTLCVLSARALCILAENKQGLSAHASLARL